MKTVMYRRETPDFFTFPNSTLSEYNENISFEILGQTPDRSYEDRDVYINIKSQPDFENNKNSSIPDAEICMWINGEDAISLGMSLIKQGQFALEANMIQHQLIYMDTQLDKFIKEDRIKIIIVEMINDKPVNYGKGFKEFNIKPVFKDGETPKYQEDFNFNEVIFWSLLEEDYNMQIKNKFGDVPFVFIGYNHDEEMKKFKKSIEDY